MRITSTIALLVLVAAGISGVGGSAGAGASGSPTPNLDEHFLTVRPAVGATWVVDLAGMGPGERMLLRSLQGQVNHSEARLYLLDPTAPGNRTVLDSYVSRGLVTVAGTTDLAGALDLFGSEVAGFEVAEASEPWTFGVGATIAATDGGVVLTPDLIATAEAHGLVQLHDLRGRWSDAATAYTETLATYRSSLDYPGIAVLKPENTSWDFAIQQRMPVVYTRPDRPDWSAVASLITASEPGHAVYGYLSDTGAEEGVAITTLSSAGLFLVPSDTTQNLSFHVAVGADRPLTQQRLPDLDDVAACDADEVNVVVGITDGDNLGLPLDVYQGPSYWSSPSRGTLPLGWSIGPQLGVLAPAVWDDFVTEATPADELVGMIGYGYTAPALLDDPRSFYDNSFALMASMGMGTFWSLGGGLEAPSSRNWTDVDGAAAAAGAPTGVLVGYGSGTGVGSAYRSPGGLPAFTAGTSYDDDGASLAGRIETLLAMPPSARPLVNFLSVRVWGNSIDAIVGALRPFEDRGVRFLTPAEATACMPPAPTGQDGAGPGQCLPTATPVESGLAFISSIVAGEVEAVPTTFDAAVSVDAAPTVESGGPIDYHARVSLDLYGLTHDVLTGRVRPIVAAAGLGDEITESTWVEMAFRDLTLRFVLPDGVEATGTPVVDGPGDAEWSAEGRVLEVDLGAASVDSRDPSPPIEVEVDFTASAGMHATTTEVALVPGATTFELDLTVGALLDTTPLTGTVTAPWACEPASGVLVSTTVLAAAGPTSTAPPTTAAPPTAVESPTTTTGVPSSTTMPGTDTTSTVAAPSTTSGSPTSTTSGPGVGTTSTMPLPSTTAGAPAPSSGLPASTTVRPGIGPASTAAPARPIAEQPSYTG